VSGTSGEDAIPSTPVDIVPGFVDSGQTIEEFLSPSAVAVGDLDNDGDLDVIYGNSGQVSTVWFNNGAGILTDSGQNLGTFLIRGLAVGDLDRDGYLDLVYGTSSGQPNLLWFNDGAGTFSSDGSTVGSNSTRAVVLGDVDRDGDLDAVTAQNGANLVYLNDGSGVFTDSGLALGGFSSISLGMGDLDGDGDLDLVEGNGGDTRIWRNDSAVAGTVLFTDTGQSLASSSVWAVALGDLDGDGDLDIVSGQLGVTGIPNAVYFNNGTGIFSDSGQALGAGKTRSLVLLDFDGDGDLDLYEGNEDVGRVLHINDGSGNFVESAQNFGNGMSLGLGAGDMDGDGDMDILEGNNGSNNRVLLNSLSGTWGSATFTDSGQLLTGTDSWGLTLADVDADGDLDIVQVNGANPARVYLNDGSGTYTDSGQSLAGPNQVFDVEAGDLDLDGDLDLALGSYAGTDPLYFNDGGGVFNTTSQVIGSKREQRRVSGPGRCQFRKRAPGHGQRRVRYLHGYRPGSRQQCFLCSCRCGRGF
jgi:hypothetical protein